MILFSGFDLSNVATLITTAFYQPPNNANPTTMTRLRRIGHLMILYYLPLAIYVPAGLISALKANGSIGFGPFENNLVLQILAGTFCFAPFAYLLFSMIYYGVSV